MNTISSILTTAVKSLNNKFIKTADIDSEILLSNILNKNRDFLFLNSLFIVSDYKLEIFNKLLKRRAKGEPIAYILKKKKFLEEHFLCK